MQNWETCPKRHPSWADNPMFCPHPIVPKEESYYYEHLNLGRTVIQMDNVSDNCNVACPTTGNQIWIDSSLPDTEQIINRHNQFSKDRAGYQSDMLSTVMNGEHSPRGSHVLMNSSETLSHLTQNDIVTLRRCNSASSTKFCCTHVISNILPSLHGHVYSGEGSSLSFMQLLCIIITIMQMQILQHLHPFQQYNMMCHDMPPCPHLSLNIVHWGETPTQSKVHSYIIVHLAPPFPTQIWPVKGLCHFRHNGACVGNSHELKVWYVDGRQGNTKLFQKTYWFHANLHHILIGIIEPLETTQNHCPIPSDCSTGAVASMEHDDGEMI